MEKIKTVHKKGDRYYLFGGYGRKEFYNAGRWGGGHVLVAVDAADSLVLVYEDAEMVELQESGEIVALD